MVSIPRNHFPSLGVSNKFIIEADATSETSVADLSLFISALCYQQWVAFGNEFVLLWNRLALKCTGMQTFTSHVGADGATSCSDFIFTCPEEFLFVISVLQFLALQEMWITKEAKC
nr:hypothetical protein CFP56_43506 [Quercus suber]